MQPGEHPGQRPGGKGEVIVGHGYAAQANIMVSDQTVKNLAETFERTKGDLADRLMAALKAGQAGGGDKRGMQSRRAPRGPEERRLPRRQRPLHRHPGLRRRRPDR